jgi:hypothetical protein
MQIWGQVSVAHTCNPSYSGRDQKDHGLRPAQAKGETLSQKYPTHKKEVAHELEHLPRKPWVQTPELEKEMQTWESSFI